MNINNIFIENIRLLTKMKGWSGADVVRESKKHGGIAQRTISNILRDDPVVDKINPTISSLETFAKIFDVNVAYLVTQRGESHSVSKEDLSKSLKGGYNLLVEAGRVDGVNNQVMSKIINELSIAQHLSYVVSETGDYEVMLKGMLKLVSQK